MHNLTLSLASTVIDNVLDIARDRGLAPLAVAVLDAAGQLIAFKRQDQSSLLRGDIAIGKAWGVLAAGYGARELVRRTAASPAFFQSLITLSGGKMVPGIGAVLVRDDAGAIIGAVGVSGDTSDNDEGCAVAGVRRAGLGADTGDA